MERPEHRKDPRAVASASLALGLAIGGLASCGVASDPAPVGRAEQPIVNGAPASDFPYAAAIGDENGPSPAGFCSATLITARLALSAAHCGAGMPADYVASDLRLFFGATISSYEHAVGVDDWPIHPAYSPTAPDGEGRPHDVSLLVLAEDVPIPPAHIRLTSVELADLAEGVTSVGYGCTTWGGSDFGEKRSALLTVDTVADLFLYSLTDTNSDEANICSGDSGGGMFAAGDGDWVQVGVHSEGVAFLAGVPVVTVSGRVDASLPWLLDQVEAVHGERDICRVNGWYADGTGDPGCAESDPDCETNHDAGAGGTGGSGGAGAPPGPDAEPDGPPDSCQCSATPAPSPGLAVAAWLAAWVTGRRRRKTHRVRGPRE